MGTEGVGLKFKVAGKQLPAEIVSQMEGIRKLKPLKEGQRWPEEVSQFKVLTTPFKTDEESVARFKYLSMTHNRQLRAELAERGLRLSFARQEDGSVVVFLVPLKPRKPRKPKVA